MNDDFYKLNVFPEIKKEIVSLILDLKEKFNELEKPNYPCKFWCVEGMGDQSYIDYFNFKTELKNINWERLEFEIPKLVLEIQKYKLLNFFSLIADHNFRPHRHLVRHKENISTWFIVFFENHGGDMVFVEPKNFDISNEIDQECSPYDNIPDEFDYEIIKKYKVESGDLCLVNTWKWHTFYTDNDKDAKTFTLSVNTKNIEEYCSYLKNLQL